MTEVQKYSIAKQIAYLDVKWEKRSTGGELTDMAMLTQRSIKQAKKRPILRMTCHC
jgi:hypothetical protein